MLTIQKLEKGYGVYFEGRLISVEEKPENYNLMINRVIKFNVEECRNVYRFSEKQNAYIHVAIVPHHITSESDAIDWHEEQLIKRQK